MPEKQVRELLKKYLEGRATPEDVKMIDEWYESMSASDVDPLSETERTRLRNAYWDAIQSEMKSQQGKRRDLWPRIMAVAASVSLVLLLTFYVVWPEKVDSVIAVVSPEGGITHIENYSPEIMIAALPDSSRIELFPQSTLSYETDFGSVDRKVKLTGEAFFDVRRDEEKPFYVFSGEVVTQVLGTSFRVSAYPDSENITVAVSTGSVSVYAKADAALPLSKRENVILTPNQQAVFNKGEETVSRTLVKEPKPVVSESESAKVRFEGALVSEVFTALEKMYQVDIEFDKEVFAECSITTSVTGEDLFERIDVICEVIGATYQVSGTRILISGSGCN